MERTYQSKQITELEALVSKFWSSAAELRQVAHELGFRSTARAARLQQKIQARLSEFSSGGSQAEHTSGEDALFAHVGLHPSAPTFLIHAAHKAFRKQYHPDAYSTATPEERRQAEERFKQVEVVFDKINQLRS